MKTLPAQLLGAGAGIVAAPFLIYVTILPGQSPGTAGAWAMILSIFMISPVVTIMLPSVLVAPLCSRWSGLPRAIGYPVWGALAAALGVFLFSSLPGLLSLPLLGDRGMKTEMASLIAMQPIIGLGAACGFIAGFTTFVLESPADGGGASYDLIERLPQFNMLTAQFIAVAVALLVMNIGVLTKDTRGSVIYDPQGWLLPIVLILELPLAAALFGLTWLLRWSARMSQLPRTPFLMLFGALGAGVALTLFKPLLFVAGPWSHRGDWFDPTLWLLPGLALGFVMCMGRVTASAQATSN